MAFFDIIKMIFPLLLIIALLGSVLWFVKKYSYQSRNNGGAAVDVNVVFSKMILPKKYISVVKIKDRLLVLGVSESSINLLKEFEISPEESINTESSGKENFMQILKKNLNFR